eukprot:tig00000430_g637.t1
MGGCCSKKPAANDVAKKPAQPATPAKKEEPKQKPSAAPAGAGGPGAPASQPGGGGATGAAAGGTAAPAKPAQAVVVQTQTVVRAVQQSAAESGEPNALADLLAVSDVQFELNLEDGQMVNASVIRQATAVAAPAVQQGKQAAQQAAVGSNALAQEIQRLEKLLEKERADASSLVERIEQLNTEKRQMSRLLVEMEGDKINFERALLEAKRDRDDAERRLRNLQASIAGGTVTAEDLVAPPRHEPAAKPQAKPAATPAPDSEDDETAAGGRDEGAEEAASQSAPPPPPPPGPTPEELAAQRAAMAKAIEESYAPRVEALEKEVASLRGRTAELEAALAAAEARAAAAEEASARAGGTEAVLEALRGDLAADRARLAEATKEKEALGKGLAAREAEVADLKERLADVMALKAAEAERQAQIAELKAALADSAAVIESMKKKEAKAAQLKGELEKLAAAVEAARKEAAEAEARRAAMEHALKDEVILRKKYYNTIEDMKGKIRVFARTRPRLPSEQGNPVLVFPDPYTIEVPGRNGQTKSFQFDACFPEDTSQERVFEDTKTLNFTDAPAPRPSKDTKNLIQSAVDGFNVCIFAYGQTGSGKTLRLRHAPLLVCERDRKKFTFSVSSYMLELYMDQLWDVLAPPAQRANAPKLEVKKDARGMVYVPGVTTVQANSLADLKATFEQGLEQRHVASTRMNADSSRSHLVFSVVIEATNLKTGVKTAGKLSLVDLAGSERVAKSEASGATLKEAQSINKSLSALGDVIAALSSGADFIPYRNHKITMLMQDSLGGNAKTLMFVNVSPTDYNADESANSLQYAARVKTITNNATVAVESKEIQRLKGIISELRGRLGEGAAAPSSAASGPAEEDPDEGS